MTRLKRYISIILTLSILLCFAGCSEDVTTADTFFMKKENAAADASSENTDTELFCDATAFDELTEISQTDMSTLCFSENTLLPYVYDSGADRIWRALPEEYTGEKTGVILITVLVNGNEYTLNSQSDCRASEGIAYETNEDSIEFKYGFYKKLSDGTVIDITVPAVFSGVDGTVSVSIDCSAVDMGQTSDGVVLSTISVLPWLGACHESAEGDFLLIPDGSGLLIDTATPSESTESYEAEVYSESEGASAIIPVFGMKSGESAFIAVIDEGDALAKIKAHKASADEGSNRVYAEFSITPSLKAEDGYYVSSVGYKGNIKLSYRFVSKENADYSSMATVARELMIRNGSISTGYGTSVGAYPFNLSLIGVADSKAYTDFAQCYDILEALTSRGINNINLRYRGVYQGGTEQEYGIGFDERLGKQEQLSELETLAASQDINIYAQTNLFTFADKTEDTALDISGNEATAHCGGFMPYEGYLCSFNKMNERINSLLYTYRTKGFTGICINDGGKTLPEDFTKGEVSLRSDGRTAVHTQTNGISATKAIAVNKGNLYAIKYADIIFDLPDSSFYGDETYLRQIPFVQIVLHGICDYSLSPVNLAEDSTDAFLKAIEYGAIPFYEWYYADLSDGTAADSYHYLNYASQARQQYELASAALNDLRDSRITDHGMASEKVYYTVYDNETEIYVNYSDEAVTVSGVTVEPKSFIRVN